MLLVALKGLRPGLGLPLEKWKLSSLEPKVRVMARFASSMPSPPEDACWKSRNQIPYMLEITKSNATKEYNPPTPW